MKISHVKDNFSSLNLSTPLFDHCILREYLPI